MFRLPYVIGALALAAALVVGTGSQGQDKGDEPKKGDDPKKAVQLPAGWGSGCTARRASHLRPASRLR